MRKPGKNKFYPSIFHVLPIEGCGGARALDSALSLNARQGTTMLPINKLRLKFKEDMWKMTTHCPAVVLCDTGVASA